MRSNGQRIGSRSSSCSEVYWCREDSGVKKRREERREEEREARREEQREEEREELREERREERREKACSKTRNQAYPYRYACGSAEQADEHLRANFADGRVSPVADRRIHNRNALIVKMLTTIIES